MIISNEIRDVTRSIYRDLFVRRTVFENRQDLRMNQTVRWVLALSSVPQRVSWITLSFAVSFVAGVPHCAILLAAAARHIVLKDFRCESGAEKVCLA